VVHVRQQENLTTSVAKGLECVYNLMATVKDVTVGMVRFRYPSTSGQSGEAVRPVLALTRSYAIAKCSDP
jgi:hypothetical protein